ncbi:MAG: helicase-exonuclease AddAB subunit AddA [Oscillospiraceae bacterium]
MSTRWTDEQQLAISARESSIIVSAAAGSGKTAVLVERTKQILCDRENPVPADRLIVVTYTNAAAAEMKQRLADKMDEEVENHPGDSYISHQRNLISQMEIGTIHSFCGRLIKENSQKLGVSPAFRQADAETLGVLKTEAFGDAAERLCKADSAAYNTLWEFFGGERGVYDVLQSLERFLNSIPNGEQWRRKQTEIYALSDEEFFNEFSKTIRESLSYLLNSAEKSYKFIKSVVESYSEETVKKNTPYLESVKNAIDGFAALVEEGDFDGAAGFEYKIGTLYSKAMPENEKVLKSLNQTLKNTLLTVKKKSAFDMNEIGEDRELVSRVLNALFSLYDMYAEKLGELKKESNVLSFDDLMLLAVRLLTENDGDRLVKSSFAKSISDKYDYVIVDEFQDVNEIQDTIFRMISKDEKNLFLVGDAKQSIYRFNQADPFIFIDKKEMAPYYEKGKTDRTLQKLYLTKNFRSRREVLEASNFLFERLMSKQLGDIDYKDEELLVYGAGEAFDERDDMKTELYIIDEKPCKQIDPELKGNALEAEFVAQKIRKMVDGGFEITEKDGTRRRCRYSDFAILLRSVKSKSAVYLEKLWSMDIPAVFSGGGEYFASYEIQTLINFLKVIDNPLRDIELVSVLMSPMFMFSAEEIAKIRLCDRNSSFYLALKAADDEKSKAFIALLDELREYKSGYSIERLVQKIFDETEFPAIVQVFENGGQRRLNLNVFMSKVKSYEDNSNGGLSGFLRFIDNAVQNLSEDKAPAFVPAESDGVKVMTIHASKGLEFPICFVCGLGTRFDEKDYTVKPVIMNARHGIGMKINRPEKLEKYNSLAYEELAAIEKRCFLGEEMRLLYVALTRAREKLVMTGVAENLPNMLSKRTECTDENGRVFYGSAIDAKNMLDWVVMTLFSTPLRDKLLDYCADSSCAFRAENDYLAVETVNNISSAVISAAGEEKALPDEETVEKILSEINFEYPHKALTELPAKMAVTEIVHRDSQEFYSAKRPRFMSSGGASGTETGNAYHKFMETVDFALAAENLGKELIRLESSGFMTGKQIKLLDIRKLEKALGLDTVRRMAASKMLLREYKFMTRIPASEYENSYDGDAMIAVQGIADCVFEEDGELVLVDYKTDAVKEVSELKARYERQLLMYKEPVERSLGKRVKEMIIISLSLGEEIIL